MPIPDSVISTDTKVELSKDSSGVVTTARPISAPALTLPDAPILPSERAAESVVSSMQRGSLSPTLTEDALISSGQYSGFSGTIASGFKEGLIGRLFNDPVRNFNPEEEIAFSESAEQYARENPWSTFAGEMIGRTISDSPIDIAVSGGLTMAGKFLIKAGRASSVARSSVDNIEDSVSGLTKLLSTPEYDLGKADIFKRQLIEGMFTGVISETAFQSMGKVGSGKDVIEAAIMDSIGGALFGTGFKALGELTGFSSKKMAEDTAKAVKETTGVDINQKALMAEIDNQVALNRQLPEVAEAGGDALDLTYSVNSRDSFKSRVEAELESEVKNRADIDLLKVDRREAESAMFTAEKAKAQEAFDTEFKSLLEQEARELDVATKTDARKLKKIQDRIAERNLTEKRVAAIQDAKQKVLLAQLERSSRAVRNTTAKEADDFLKADVLDGLEVERLELEELKELSGSLAEGVQRDALQTGGTYLDKLVWVDKVKKQEATTSERKLLGQYGQEDLKAYAKEAGVPVSYVRELQENMWERTNALAKEIESNNRVSRDADLGRVEANMDAGTMPTNPKQRANLLGTTRVRNSQDLMSMATFAGLSPAYAKLNHFILKNRAKIAGMTLDEWVEGKKLRYRGTDGKSHIIFDDAATIVNASRNAKDAGEFFHEIGHILEQDLSIADRKVLSENYGTTQWSKDFAERFANDYVTYINDLITTGVPDGKYNAGMRGAFKRITDWFRTVIGPIFGKQYNTGKMSDEVKDIFDNLLLQHGEEIIPIESTRTQFLNRTRAGRRSRKLFATESEIESLSPELEQFIIDKTGRGQELQNNLASAFKEVQESAFAKDNFWNGLRSKLPEGMISGIMTAKTLMEGLGPTFAKQYEKLQQAVKVEMTYIREGHDVYRAAAEKHGFTKADKLNLVKKETTREIGGKMRNANEALLLHMYAKDGYKAGKNGKHAKNSAQIALIKGGYTFKGDKKPTVFTDIEADEMASEIWLESMIGAEGVRAAKTMEDTLKVSGKTFSEWYTKTTGADAHFNPDDGYFPKKAFLDPKEIEGAIITDPVYGDLDISGMTQEQLAQQIDALAKKRGIDKGKIVQTLADTTSLNRTRKGSGVLQFQDPFAATTNYLHQQARLRALSEPLAEAQIMVNAPKMRAMITASAGKDVHSALSSILTRSAGSVAHSDPIAGKFASKLYKGQVLSSLSWNMSTPLKQLPSFMAAMSRMTDLEGSKTSAVSYLKSAITGTGEMDRAALHADMLERFPTYYNRYTNAGQSPDINDVNLGDSTNAILFSDVTLAEAFDADGVRGAAKGFVEKGMNGIREADAAVIRAVYLASTDALEVKLGRKPTDLEIEDYAAKIISDTQPNYHPLMRTSVQSSKSLLQRQLAMFSSQPVQNFNLMLRDIIEYKNLPEGPAKEAMKKKMNGSMKMLAMQASAIAAIGSITSEIRTAAFDTLKDEDAITRRDAYLKSHGLELSRHWDQVFRASFGNLPYSGPMIGEVLKRLTIGTGGFDVEVMPVNYINDLMNWSEAVRTGEQTGKESMKMMENISRVLGVPLPVSQAIRAGATNL